MKKETHPEYYPKAKVTCACGHVFYVGSTQKEMQTEICSACHPFYTGKEKLVDTAGRVEKFKKRREKAATTVRSKKAKHAVKAKKRTTKKDKKEK